MKGEDVVIGKEYELSGDYEYWCLDLQRDVKICGKKKIIVKITQTHRNKVFFGKLIDSQGELEFGPDAIVKEYVKNENETWYEHCGYASLIEYNEALMEKILAVGEKIASLSGNEDNKNKYSN